MNDSGKAKEKRANSYQCVHCGHAVSELYKDYKKGIIKISHCGSCKEVADKYIEYDPVIIFLDTLLLQRPAYRHILINSKFQGHWRLVLVLWLCDALTKLMQRKTADVTSTRLQPNYILYSALELAFYQDYLVSAAESLILFTVVLVLLAARHKMTFGNLQQFEHRAILRALVMSSVGRLLVVPALVWGDAYSSLGVALTRVFVAASNVQALTVVCRDIGLCSAILVIGMGYTVQHCVVLFSASHFIPYLSSQMLSSNYWLS